MTSKLFKDRYLFPLTNKDTMGDYKVKLYYYYFDADKKLITSLGNNYYLENSGDAVTLKKEKPEDEDDEDSDNEADSEDNDETKETNAVVNPASSEESAENSEETEELEDSEVGAYWDPGKLVYKYCVVEVEIIR